MSRSSPLSAGLALLVMIAACAQSTQDATSDAVAPERGQATTGAVTWSDMTGGIDGDGRVPIDTALRAYASTITPLSGVAEASIAGPLPPAGAPVRWLSGHLDELTSAQRAAVALATGPDAGPLAAAHDVQLAGFLPLPGFAAPDDEVAAAVRRMAADSLVAFDAEMGLVPMAVDIRLVDPDKVPLPPSPVPIWSTIDPAGRPYGCHLFVRQDQFALALERTSDAEMAAQVAVVIAACRLAAERGLDSAGFASLPAWFVEGSTLWMACRYAVDTLEVVPAMCEQSWGVYVETRDVSLFTRSFDAVGFFGQLYEDRSDLWKALAPAASSDSVAVYRSLTNPVFGDFVHEWGPGQLNWAEIGAAWTLEDPAAPDETPLATQISIQADTSVDVAASPYAVALYGIDVDAEVLTIDIDGFGRATNMGQDWILTGPLDLCNRTDGCVCPDAGVSWPYTGKRIMLGLTGDEAGTTGTVEGSDLDDFCAKVTRGENPPPSQAHGLSCDAIPRDAIARVSGIRLGEATVPTGFDPNAIGGQLGCVWIDNPGWSAQILPSDLEDVPPIAQYAAACRLWQAETAAGGLGWAACIGHNPDGYGFIDLQMTSVHILLTTEALDTPILVEIAEAIATASP